MAHLGMSDDELTTFIKDGFGVDSSFSAKDLFEAAELPYAAARAKATPRRATPCRAVPFGAG